MLRRVVKCLTRLVSVISSVWIVYRSQGTGYVKEVRVAERGPLVILVMLVALVIFLPSRVWVILLVGLGLAVGLSFGWTLQVGRKVSFDRRLLHTWVQVGDRLEEMLTLRNDSTLPVLVAEIEDHSDLPGYNASTIRTVDGLKQNTWRQVGISQRRGLFHLGPTVVRFGDPLGIFTVECKFPDTRELLVYPPILHNQSVSVPPGGGQGMATTRHRSLEETASTGSVRDYVPGDPIRRIHWPLSVRHQSFLVKEFNRDTGSNIWLVLDLDSAVHMGEDIDSTLEYGIIWAASWAWSLLRDGCGVGLYTYGPQRTAIPPARGTGQLWHILRALAPLEAQPEIPLSALLDEVGPLLARGHALVVITPSTAPDWPEVFLRPAFRSAAKEVVLLDASSFNGSVKSSSVAGMRAMLAGQGVPVHLVRRQEGLDIEPAAPGGGDWDFVVTGFGKVIVRSRPTEVDA